jgi:flagellar basal-body rod protein FlgC
MSLLDAISISASGVTAQRQRIEVTVENLANARTTRTSSGGPFQRRDVVFETAPVGHPSFSEELSLTMASLDDQPMGVRVAAVQPDGNPPQMVYDPGHPDANADGLVAFPNVNPVEEIVNLVSAARSYEANLTAITIAQGLVQRAIELGRTT